MLRDTFSRLAETESRTITQSCHSIDLLLVPASTLFSGKLLLQRNDAGSNV